MTDFHQADSEVWQAIDAERRRQRGHVYREQNARDHTQVAEVRENVGISVLPYTRHT